MKFRPMILAVAVAATGLAISPMLFAQAEKTEMKSEAKTGGEVYKIDPVHSSLVFRIMHGGTTPFYGTFNELEGTVTVDRENPANSKVEVTVNAESVDSRHEGRDKHIRSADFIDTDNHKEMKFVSTKVTSTGENSFSITGDLTLRGVTKPVTADFVVLGEATDHRRGMKVLGGEARFTFNRQDFGVAYGGLGDDVDIILGVRAVQMPPAAPEGEGQ